jgi:hypothetical protein
MTHAPVVRARNSKNAVGQTVDVHGLLVADETDLMEDKVGNNESP